MAQDRGRGGRLRSGALPAICPVDDNGSSNCIPAAKHGPQTPLSRWDLEGLNVKTPARSFPTGLSTT